MSDDVPSWPSLYNPLIELFPLQHRDPIEPSGRYLHDPHDVFRFTLYWTLILYTPAYALCGAYAFLNLAFPPLRVPLTTAGKAKAKAKAPRPGSGSYRSVPSVPGERIPLRRYSRQLGPGGGQSGGRTPARPNERRSRLTFALLVLLVFAVFAVAGALVGSAVVGYVLAGLFKAAEYNMSTWIPFIGGLLQTLVGFLGLWPTVIDFI
ncbi:hypothetical protein C8Q79DRAFT_251762 [Trametes meyenii]|nr:hypothetical protein C8Q79DRAFT_251762 [Trametes meyenii]